MKKMMFCAMMIMAMMCATTSVSAQDHKCDKNKKECCEKKHEGQCAKKAEGQCAKKGARRLRPVAVRTARSAPSARLPAARLAARTARTRVSARRTARSNSAHKTNKCPVACERYRAFCLSENRKTGCLLKASWPVLLFCLTSGFLAALWRSGWLRR